jgi:hypothetical protein
VAAFPALKTGAVAQYPSQRSTRFSTALYEFVDGSEQRFPLFGSPLRRWEVRLELLDELELFRLEQFFVEHAGAGGHFSFVDPWDGIDYPDCSFESDEVELIFAGAGNGQTTIVIQENR